MQSNPIVEKQEQEEKERNQKAAYRYPFRIVCVFMNSQTNDFPIIHEVRDYCNENNLIFVARQYNIDKYDEDMIIQRLPAFHLYYKNYVQETTYFDTNPVYMAQRFVWAYQDKQRAKERARKKWDEKIEQWKGFFSLERFKRKPALNLETSLMPL